MPLPLNVPDIENEEQLPTDPQSKGGVVNRLSQFGEGIEEGFDKTGTVFDPEKWALEYLNPGPTISSDNLPDNLKKAYPNGMGQNVFNLIQGEKEHNSEVERQLSMAPPGAFTDVSNFTSTNIGTLLGPANAVAAVVAPELMPEKMISDMGLESTANVIAHGVRGSGIGEALNTSMNANNYYYNRQLGNNPQVSDIFNGGILAGILGGAGGALYGRLHTSRVGSPMADKEVLNTAVQQANGDKPVKVDTQMQQERYQSAQSLRDEGYDPEEAQTHIDGLKQNISDINTKLNEDKDDPEIVEGLGSSQLNRLNSNLVNHASLNKKELKFTDDTQYLDYYQDLANISKTHPDMRSPEQTKSLSNFIENPDHEVDLLQKSQDNNNKNIRSSQTELMRISKNSERLQKTIDSLNEKINNLDKNHPNFNERMLNLGNKRLEAINELSDENRYTKGHLDNMSDFNKVDDHINKRLESLNKLKDISNKRLSKQIERERLKNERMDLINRRDHEEAQLSLYNTPPVTKEQVVSDRAHINDPRNDISGDPLAENRLDQEIKDSRPIELKDIEGKVKQLVDDGKIDQKSFDAIKSEHAEDPKKLSQLKKTLDKYTNCLTGANNE